VAGLSKLYSRLRRDASSIQSFADRTGLVVFDEAHQAIAPTYQLVLDILLSRKTGTQLLGLSATPGRSWTEIYKDEQLADFFGRQKVILQVDGYESPIDFLVEVGYLANPVFRDLLYEGGADVSDQDLETLEKSLDVPRTLLEQLALDEQRNLLILSAVEDLAKRHSRIIVFAPSVESANVLADVLNARGIAAQSVTGKTDAIRRQQILDQYKTKDSLVRVIVNFGVLTTGFDAPQTSAAVIGRPTQSLVLYSQMAGRALRGALVGGNANAEVVTIVDTTLPGFRAPNEMFMNWEDVW
jgi:superfamily II DNA or RNA helicase